MATSPPTLSPRRRLRLARTIAGATVVVAGTAALGYAVTGGSPAPAPAFADAGTRTTTAPQSSPTGATAATPPPSSAPVTRTSFAAVVTDRIPTPTTSIALKDKVPGTTNMQPSAASAWSSAVAAARADKVTLGLKVGWRSAAWQQVLRDKAVGTYGSEAEAAKWVLLPSQSPHVKGYAVDVTDRAGATWLEANGPALGWCRTYANEWWHFEYLATSACPAVKPNAAG